VQLRFGAEDSPLLSDSEPMSSLIPTGGITTA